MIELIVLDVDGCLSDGKITYDENGVEIKSFNVKDGFGIVSWKKLGKKLAIITGRKSNIVAKRADELKIDYLYQDVKDKKKILDEILQKEGLTYENVAVIGDDLNDVAMFKVVKNSFTPKDGLIAKYANCILSKNGGDGAVREMIDKIIEQNSLKEEFLNLWL